MNTDAILLALVVIVLFLAIGMAVMLMWLARMD